VLTLADLYEARDLALTTDFRETVGAVLASHLDLAETWLDRVFAESPASG
jgi:uncharacterized protein (DUF1501 family)